jgi:hypothetical protein
MEGKVLCVETNRIEFDPRPKVCARLEPILNRQEHSSIPILQL